VEKETIYKMGASLNICKGLFGQTGLGTRQKIVQIIHKTKKSENYPSSQMRDQQYHSGIKQHRCVHLSSAIMS